MLGVDLKYQMLQPYFLERKKSTKWYLKLFKRLLNVTIHNTYRCLPTKVQTFISTRPRGKTRFWCSSPCIRPPPKRLIERHFPEHISATGKKARPQIKCVVCMKHGERKESIYWCSECEAGLCLDGCFKTYHTNLHLLPLLRHKVLML
jgi:hypothetical protein